MTYPTRQTVDISIITKKAECTRTSTHAFIYLLQTYEASTKAERSKVFTVVSQLSQNNKHVICHSIMPFKTEVKTVSYLGLVIILYQGDVTYYKDRKCAVNENPSACIESAGSKTCDTRPLKNGSAVSNFSIVCW